MRCFENENAPVGSFRLATTGMIVQLCSFDDSHWELLDIFLARWLRDLKTLAT